MAHAFTQTKQAKSVPMPAPNTRDAEDLVRLGGGNKIVGPGEALGGARKDYGKKSK